jgi:hypothetical protein
VFSDVFNVKNVAGLIFPTRQMIKSNFLAECTRSNQINQLKQIGLEEGIFCEEGQNFAHFAHSHRRA